MKKMLLVLASVMGLGILVSCTQEPQELIITQKDDYVAYNHMYGGIATVTMNTRSNISSIEFDENDYAYISYQDNAYNTKTNCKNYRLTVPVVYKTTTTIGSTETTTTYHDSFSISFTKIGDDYKFDSSNIIANNSNNNYKAGLEGNPESSNFTIKNIKVSVNGYSVYLDSLSFTRK